MSHRVVCNVQWAKECQRPSCIPMPKRKPRGSKGFGLSYEHRFAENLRRSLPGARHGQWYEYMADGRTGFCQPDVVVPLAGAVLVLECKLKAVEQAQGQLIQLYLPVIRACYEKPTWAAIVVRSLSALPAGSLVARNLLEALQMAKADVVPVLHWLGRGPI
jgi:hypothetical protein